MKRRRTHAKFFADLRMELVTAVHQSDLGVDQMSDWTLNHSEVDLRTLPALGLYREVMHEKLCDPALRWEDNDLIDMMFLTVGAGYCSHTELTRSTPSAKPAATRPTVVRPSPPPCPCQASVVRR